MNGRECGFLLLTSHLGDPARKVLTAAQFRELTKRMLVQDAPKTDRELQLSDLMAMGYSVPMAERILQLLSEEDVLQDYLLRGKRAGCVPVTRVSEEYPLQLRKRLGLDSPGVLWVKGNAELLTKPAVALVGSRELREENEKFAAELGKQAAKWGCVLISGNAKGADKTAQKACLDAGGQVISVVADALQNSKPSGDILFVAEDGFDLLFSPQRALSRNRVIHALAQKTFVAQCTLGKGGTWDGTCNNLRYGWSPVFCYKDGSEAMTRLCQYGAVPVSREELKDIDSLVAAEENFLNI